MKQLLFQTTISFFRKRPRLCYKFIVAISFLLFIPFYGNAQNWVQIGNDITGQEDLDWAGYSVSLNNDGSILAVGAPLNDGIGSDAGNVRVFQNNDGSWVQLGSDINGEAAGDELGHSVSLSANGNILAVGAPLNHGTGSWAGHVRVYQFESGDWQQLGNDIDSEAEYDRMGLAVSLSNDGSILAIGAPFNKGNGTDAGHVRVYQYSSGTWSQLGNDIDGEAAKDTSGHAISLSADGTILAIGATKNDGNATDAGHVRVYQYNAGNWTQIGGDIDGEAAYDEFGNSISLSDDGLTLAVGAHQNDRNGQNTGHVRVNRYENNAWSQLGDDIEGKETGDWLGHSVSLSADGIMLAIGIPSAENTSATEVTTNIYELNDGSWLLKQEGLKGFAVCLSSDGTTLASGHYGHNGTGRVVVYQQNKINGSETKIKDIFKNNTSIFPNPSSGKVVVDLNNIDIKVNSVSITNLTGETILDITPENGINELDLSNYPKGIYMLILKTDKGNSTKKIILE